MPSFECNETQFIENISRLLESENRFMVNRRVQVYDDRGYGLAGLPDEAFVQFSSILTRKSQRLSVYMLRLIFLMIITVSLFFARPASFFF